MAEGLFHRFFEWLTRPSLSVRLLQQQLELAQAENRRLTDLLTQAWEQTRVVPVQPEHLGPSQPLPEQQLSYGEIQAQFARESEERYQQWQAEENERLRILAQIREGQQTN